MKSMLRIGTLALSLALFLTTAAFAQVQISGTVTDGDTGEALPGANVVVEGTALGAATDANGRYTIPGVTSGTYAVTASFIGYEPNSRRVTVGSTNLTVNFEMEFANQSLQALEVFASRAIDRKTPVAYTNVDKVQIQRELASRDVPLILNTTPSVYATAQGGGAGDARVNVRGFNQRNTAIMINGVPVNDMENGWVYWSNWDGVGDATSSIQLQRGLSAVNLATPSIGGTMNIITDPAALGRSVKFKQEVGNDGFLKSTATVSSGLMDGKFAFTLSGVRKTGDGYYDGTWTDAWAYYAAAAWNVNSKHRIDFYAVGAPQRHGQNLYRQNIAAYDHKYAREVLEDDGVSSEDITAILDKYPESGRRWNENVGKVSTHPGTQNNGFSSVDTPGKCTIGGKEFTCLNERENFFHKPQLNVNWYAQFTDKMLLSTVLYYSGGKGGGTGTKGDMTWDYSGPSRVVNYDATIAVNQGAFDRKGRAKTAGVSNAIMRNSHNVQWTIGAISKLRYTVNENLGVEVGVDWRTAEIEHYRSVRDLLGGSSYLRYDSDFWGAGGKQLQPGDRFDYNNTNTVDWLGGFVQGEYVKDKISFYGMAGLSMIKYSYKDFFKDDGTGNPFFVETDNLSGYQIKGGGLYNVNDQFGIFANAGVVSRTPIFDGAIDDVTGRLNTDPQNEQFLSLEAGASFRSVDRTLAGKVNVYYTDWTDRTVTRNIRQENGDEGIIAITGLNALHQGIEAELAYQPLDMFRFDGAASIANWTYTDDVNARYTPDKSDPNTQLNYDLYIKDLKVGDAPQTQFAYSVTVFPVDGLYAKFLGRTYSNYYANFDPTTRSDAADRGQVWKIPSYNLFDVFVGFDIPRDMLKTSRFDIRLFANVFNVFDSFYVQDATDNSRFNAYKANGKDHRADDAEVHLGLPRSFNFGTQITFR